MTLYETVEIEFLAHRDCVKLFEKYGIVPGMDKIINYVADSVIRTIIDKGDDFNEYVVLNDTEFEMPYDMIFINVKYIKNNKEGKSYVEGSYDMTSDSIVKMTLMCYGEDLDYIYDEIKGAMMHELTHAYEDYKRKENDPEKSLFKTIDNFYIVSRKIRKNPNDFNPYTVAFANIYYAMDKMEQRANLGRLEQDIYKYADNIYNEKQATKYLLKTTSYRNIQNTVTLMGFILKNKESFDIIAREINDLMEQKYTNPQKILSFLKSKYKELKEYERKFNINAAKLAYKIYSEK